MLDMLVAALQGVLLVFVSWGAYLALTQADRRRETERAPTFSRRKLDIAPNLHHVNLEDAARDRSDDFSIGYAASEWKRAA